MNGSKVINVEKELKKVKRREWIREKYERAKEFCFNNPQITMILVSGTVVLITTMVKTIGKQSNLAKEEHVKEEYCYDRSLGHYWALRRKLTNDEWVEIDRRKRDGERLADILDSFKVLK